MLRVLIVGVTLLLSTASAAFADLRFTIRTEVRKLEGTASADPILAKLGEMLTNAIAPGGSARTVFVVGDKAARIELGSAVGNLSEGTVLLRRADGSVTALNPATLTYRKMGVPDSRNRGLGAASPKVSSVRTGEFATIAGVSAERVTLNLVFDMAADAAKLPPGLPSTWTIEWDMWITHRFKVPPSLVVIGNPAIRALGLEKFLEDGLVMRQVLRSTMFAGYEIESLVTEIADAPVDPQVFEIPSDYKPASAQ